MALNRSGRTAREFGRERATNADKQELYLTVIFTRGSVFFAATFKPIPILLESKTSVAESLLCFSAGTTESHDTTPSVIAAVINRIASLQFAREKRFILSRSSPLKDDRLNGQIPAPDNDAAALMCTSAWVAPQFHMMVARKHASRTALYRLRLIGVLLRRRLLNNSTALSN